MQDIIEPYTQLVESFLSQQLPERTFVTALLALEDEDTAFKELPKPIQKHIETILMRCDQWQAEVGFSEYDTAAFQKALETLKEKN